MTYFLEFCDADDQRLKATFVDRITSDIPIAIPATGDTVMVEQRLFTIVHRHIWYNGHTTILCYCRAIDERHIMAACGQSVDLSEPTS